MSHEFDSGYFVRKPAWHGLGNVLQEAPANIDEARIAAGLTWEPRKIPVFQRVEELVGMNEGGEPVVTEKYIEVPNACMIERDDTNTVIGHGMADGFEPILNRTMFEVLEVLTSQGAKHDTAGSIRGGAVTWGLVKLDEPYALAGDDSESYPYVSVVNYHDGTGAMRAQAGSVRVQCANTIQSSSLESERTGRFFVFRHTANVMERIDEAKLALAGARTDARHWRELASELLGLKVTSQSYAAFLSEFIPEPPANVISERVRDNIAKARETFSKCYNGRTNAAAHGTGLALVNASVEYLDHLRAYRSRDSYINRTLLRPEPLKGRAVKLVREVCGV